MILLKVSYRKEAWTESQGKSEIRKVVEKKRKTYFGKGNIKSDKRMSTLPSLPPAPPHSLHPLQRLSQELRRGEGLVYLDP